MLDYARTSACLSVPFGLHCKLKSLRSTERHRKSVTRNVVLTPRTKVKFKVIRLRSSGAKFTIIKTFKLYIPICVYRRRLTVKNKVGG